MFLIIITLLCIVSSATASLSLFSFILENTDQSGHQASAELLNYNMSYNISRSSLELPSWCLLPGDYLMLVMQTVIIGVRFTARSIRSLFWEHQTWGRTKCVPVYYSAHTHTHIRMLTHLQLKVINLPTHMFLELGGNQRSQWKPTWTWW